MLPRWNKKIPSVEEMLFEEQPMDAVEDALYSEDSVITISLALEQFVTVRSSSYSGTVKVQECFSTY